MIDGGTGSASCRGRPGELALVLHTHVPWLAGHGTWPVGEEWLFQAWGTSWYPVTDLLWRLADEGHRDVLTLGVTPMVAAQVADRRLRDDMGTWLGGQMWRAEEQRQAGWYLEPGLTALGPFHWRHHARLLAIHEWVEAAGGLLAVWRSLADEGVIEVLGGPVSHPYLPLLSEPALVDGQLAAGLAAHARWLGRDPSGLWPPELGHRPAGQVADPTRPARHVDRHGTPTLVRTGPVVAGLDAHYARHGIDHMVVDAPTLIRAAGGRDRDWTVRPSVAPAGVDHPDDVVHDGVLVGDGDVVAFARDLSVAYHVWSPTAGYPGHPDYRDFHARGNFGLHPSWRVTGLDVDMWDKEVYDPGRVDAAVDGHVDHFTGVVHDVTDARDGALVVAAYDTELFGHWWFEGPTWLERLLRRVHADPDLTTTTLASRRRRRPPTRRLHLAESSWGYAKGHASWSTPETRPMWDAVRTGEAEVVRAIRDHAAACAVAADDALEAADAIEDAAADVASDPAIAAVVAAWCQLAASDWPFMVARDVTPDYGKARVATHRAELTAALARLGTPPRVIPGPGGTTTVELPTPAPSHASMGPDVVHAFVAAVLAADATAGTAVP